MSKITILFGALLCVLGVGFYVGTGQTSVTALIPSFLGLVFILVGALGLKPNLHKHAMHAAAVLALLGFLASLRGVFGFVKILSGAEVERPYAIYEQTVMGLLCLIFTGLCIKSFIDVRRKREANTEK